MALSPAAVELASDPIVIGILLLAVIGALAALPALTGAWEQRLRRQRLDTYIHRKDRRDSRENRSEAKRKQINNKLKTLRESKRHGKSRIGSVRRHIVRAGFDLTLTQFWMVCVVSGFIAAMVWLLIGAPAAFTPLAFMLFTLFVPQAALKAIAANRQKKFTKHFPDAVDVLVRGLKSGLPVGECFRIIARESEEPVGPEFRIVMDEVHAGLTMEEALERCYERMPTQELRFFTTVISVQAQTGGNLAEILSNISSVLRGRAQLREKIKALSGEARASSVIIGSLPFIIGIILHFMNPEYIATLWTTRSGIILLCVAASLMTTGIWIMNRMGKLET